MLALTIQGLHEQVTTIVAPGQNLEREIRLLEALRFLDEEITRGSGDTQGQHAYAFAGKTGRQALEWYIQRWQDELATQVALDRG